ncbi:MAG: DUF3368 domain-containing protein, partial [Pyrinomonadaceae bacterium]
VFGELKAIQAPTKVQEWLSSGQDWLVVEPVHAPDLTLTDLDVGEREIITLAEQKGADLILLDERRERQAAARMVLL